MTAPAARPSPLAPVLTLIVAVSTLIWGLRSSSAWVIQNAFFGLVDAGVSAEVRTLILVFALCLLEAVLALALTLARWRPGSLHMLGLCLIVAGVILGQLLVRGPFWALALLGAWLVW
ncbi:MAG: hypothetical protein VX152_06355, partial [Pseudomonadota bacterium]|nr:hypothetical protein [Pseudomonadota bacterium]